MSWSDDCGDCGHKNYCDSVTSLWDNHEHEFWIPCLDGKSWTPENCLGVKDEEDESKN